MHTRFPFATGDEFTDVVFDNVLIQYFEDAQFGEQNILFDVGETPLSNFIEQMKEVLDSKRNYRWPPLQYGDFPDLEVQLSKLGVRAFQISTSLGLSGWVLAKSCRRERRTTRAVFKM